MKNEIAVFGGGCFWCTEAVFKSLNGVKKVLPGYSGGTTVNPNYYDVSSGKSGHAEVVYIEYEPEEISYKDLLTVLFASHDPTTPNQQGADIGEEYRSVIFYTTEDQKNKAENFISELNASSKYGKKIVTSTEPLKNFYEAENYHKEYYDNHQGNLYCELVINPKLQKIQNEFAELLKKQQSK